MQEFLFTSKKFEGSMRFVYSNGVLELFENKAELTAEQISFFEHNFPFRIQDLEKIKGPTGRLQEVTDLSFAAFWEAYDYKVDKINAAKYWDKMSDKDKAGAMSGINRYKTRCRMSNTALIYPVRYLRNRRWEDEK